MQSPIASEKEKIVSKILNSKAAHDFLRYGTYLQYYEYILQGHANSFVVSFGDQAYSTHADLISALDRLIGSPLQTKETFTKTFPTGVSVKERDHAVRALLRVALMIDCPSKQDLPEGYKIGDYMPHCWGEQQPFSAFVQTYFPSPIHTPATRTQIQRAVAQKSRLKAWKLKERYKVKLRPTDDLAEHLVFDRERRTIKIFRHVSFLTAHLDRSRDKGIDMGFHESLETGTLPPQLLLEALDSIQYLLFPNDEKSVKSLDKFIRKHNFDPYAKFFGNHVRELPEDFEYKYFGGRLVKLLDIVDNPPPANRVVAWFERHSSERNALTVAILGLFLTALFGFLSLVFGIVSTVYSIKQYNVALQALAIPSH